MPRRGLMPPESKTRSILAPSHWRPLGTASTTAVVPDDGNSSTRNLLLLCATHPLSALASQSSSISQWLARRCPMFASDTTPTLLARFTQLRRAASSATWRRRRARRQLLLMDHLLRTHRRFLLEPPHLHHGRSTLRVQSCRGRRQAQSSTSTTNATASQSQKMATATSTRTRVMSRTTEQAR